MVQIQKQKSQNIISKCINTPSVKIRMSEGMPMDEIEARIETLRAVVKELHKNSDNTRDESLLERANMAEDADDKKKARAIRQIKNTEQQARAFLKLKFNR
jgi:D-alanyl-D-alanine carboxypeptidase